MPNPELQESSPFPAGGGIVNPGEQQQIHTRVPPGNPGPPETRFRPPPQSTLTPGSLATRLRRPVIDEFLAQATEKQNDPGIAREAALIPALQRIRVAVDQLHGTISDDIRVSGAISPLAKTHVHAVLNGMERDMHIVRAAHEAADRMYEETWNSLDEMEKTMADQDNKAGQPPPAQTTDVGVAHPLQQGGYDPDADPQKPVEESDVAALKAGHGTKAMTEAQNKARADQIARQGGNVPNNQGQTAQSNPPPPPPDMNTIGPGAAPATATSATDDVARTNPAADPSAPRPGDKK